MLLSAWDQRGEGMELLLPEHDGVPGHPLMFSTTVRDAVLDGGSVPGWRKTHANAVLRLPASHPRYTTDLDTVEDLERLQQALPLKLELPG